MTAAGLKTRARATEPFAVNPITHFLSGWALAHTAPLGKRDRAVVAAAATVPDLDGLGIAVDLATRAGEAPTAYWEQFHHVLGHNLGCGLLVAAAAAAIGRRPLLCGALALVAFHLHLLGDLLGSRGPDGYAWSIPYLKPFSNAGTWVWSGQWALDAWPNFAITLALLAIALGIAWRRGSSPLEIVSARANAALVEALRHRFGAPAGAHTAAAGGGGSRKLS